MAEASTRRTLSIIIVNQAHAWETNPNHRLFNLSSGWYELQAPFSNSKVMIKDHPQTLSNDFISIFSHVKLHRIKQPRNNRRKKKYRTEVEEHKRLSLSHSKKKKKAQKTQRCVLSHLLLLWVLFHQQITQIIKNHFLLLLLSLKSQFLTTQKENKITTSNTLFRSMRTLSILTTQKETKSTSTSFPWFC